MAMQACAVIGGTGFIGTHLVNALVATGRCSVLSLSRRDAKRVGAAPHRPVDMRDAAALEVAFDGVDTVFHLAATIPNAFTHEARAVWEGNRLGAESIVAACRVAGVARLVNLTGHLTAPEGGTPDEFPFLSGKAAAEELILAANGPGLATCSLRVPVIFGTGDKISVDFVAGRSPAFPRFDRDFAFMSVDDLVPLIVRAGELLTARDARVLGAAVEVQGERMSFEAFFAQPAWGRPPPRSVPWRTVRVAAGFNALCARVFGAAPLGAELCPLVLNALGGPARRAGGRPAVEALGLAAESPRSVNEAIAAFVATARVNASAAPART
jgi:nucleoside-diphosphate-sugar epimerase